MKRLWPVLLLVAAIAQAEEATSTGDLLVPVRSGYVFENPDLLLRQSVFGLAHGVHLLLSACLDKNENAAAALEAYAAWHATQEKVLDDVRGTLAVHHFGVQAERAQWQDIARVLGLKETIYPSLGGIGLTEACATLPQALAQPHYDFNAQFDLANDPAAR